MKKIGIIILIIIILVASFYVYIGYRKKSVENSVIEYLTIEKSISENDIISTEPFISNLSGNKNFMVSIKLKDDDKTYFYYKDNNGRVILESYTENGTEHLKNN